MSSVFEQQTAEVLTAEEKQAHVRDEAIINEHLAGARQVFAALLRIKDRRSYRASGYSSFERYVEIKWAPLYGDMGRVGLWRSLEHERTVQAVEAANSNSQENHVANWQHVPVPTAEAQTRPLHGMPVEDRLAILALAAEESGGAVPTAAQVAAVAQAIEPQRATSERIGRLDTDRTARPKPQAPGQTFRKGFRVSEFKFDAAMRRFHFQVFKPANTFKGWPSKTEQLQISLSDLEWELRNIGFDLVKTDGPATVAADDAEDDEPVDATGEQADPADVALTLDLPADVDVGVRALVAKERRRIASFTKPTPAAEEEPPVAPSFVTGDVSYLDELAQPNPVGAFFADWPQ